MATHAPITGAPTRATSIDRRHLFAAIGAVAFAPAVALALPAPASQVPALVAANVAAEARFNALDGEMERENPEGYKIEEDRMSAAWHAVLDAEPANWSDFTAQLAVATNDAEFGLDEDRAATFLARARRLSGEGR